MNKIIPSEGNPHVSRKKKPRVKTGRLYINEHEAKKLIDAAAARGRNPLRDKVLVRMTYRHGLRASEAVAMRWDQIDFDTGIIYVKRSKNGNPSTHSMDRDELHDLRKLRKEAGPTDLNVFVSERGGPLSVDMLARIIKEASVAAELEVPVHPHMLRHGAGYSLINAGQDVRVVQDFLGHKSVTTTALYTALSPRRLAAVRVREG